MKKLVIALIVLQSTTEFLLLLVLSCVSFLFSVFFYLKSRTLRRISRYARVRAYDETFKIVNPYPEHKKIINNVVLALILAVVLPFSLWFWIGKILELGLLVSINVVILWMGLMLLHSALEIYKSADSFTKALKNKVKLGKGDLAALFFLNKTMPRLSVYYLVVAVGFSISSVLLPYIAPFVLEVFSYYVNITVELVRAYGATNLYPGILFPIAIITVLPLTIIAVLILVVGGKIKNKILSFPTSIPQTALDEPFERVHIMRMWGRENPPFELGHRPVLEDPEVEEKKRKWLMRSK